MKCGFSWFYAILSGVGRCEIPMYRGVPTTPVGRRDEGRREPLPDPPALRSMGVPNTCSPARHAGPRSGPDSVRPAVRFDKQRPVHSGRQQLFATVIRVASGKKVLRIKVFNVCDVIKTEINLPRAVFARDRCR